MKKIILAIAAIAIGLNANAQKKIYDFPFNNSLSATVGTGTFGNTGATFTSDRKSTANSALSVSGTEINAPLSALPKGNSVRTVALWFNRQGGGNVGMFSYGASANLEAFGITFASNGGLVFQGFGTANETVLGIAGVSFNTWHHLAVVYTGTDVKVYFNGKLTNTFAVNLNTGSGAFKFGNMVGYFDDLKIYDNILSDVQVTQLYSNNDITSVTGIEAGIKSIAAIYPNPANTVLNIEIKENTDIKIVNIMGSTVASQKLHFGHNAVDVSSLKNGLYFIHNEKGGVIKFVKE